VVYMRMRRPDIREDGSSDWSDTLMIRNADATFAGRVLSGEASAALPPAR
jgi:hypothetical protein